MKIRQFFYEILSKIPKLERRNIVQVSKRKVDEVNVDFVSFFWINVGFGKLRTLFGLAAFGFFRFS